ncbi:hypothetical protein GT347_22945 [Xylophilus rhododendri]|uniref:Uncharacterized protein n=1 Tax=Xylophilus rhododendri TaxID=2697032 RepID=A0A857JBI5_9BURK|nr:hypothetical protein [Xylophilus rhododendri]QHJ00584.1 hypothetical protein GT347_22945 [Xylophilus rhododendri]
MDPIRPLPLPPLAAVDDEEDALDWLLDEEEEEEAGGDTDADADELLAGELGSFLRDHGCGGAALGED